MNKKLILIGASGHGKVIADIAKRVGYAEIAFLDDGESVVHCAEYDVLGKSDSAKNYADCDFAVSIGNAQTRQKMIEKLESADLPIVTLIHPNAVVAEDAKIGKGTVIMAGAVVSPCVEIGRGCIINTCASVDHDCQIGNYVHVAVGAHVAGDVTVGDYTWIGAGSTVINDLTIVGKCMVGAGATVVKNIEEPGTYIGVPARKVRADAEGER